MTLAKRVLVTGGSSGIGEAVVRKLTGDGCIVAGEVPDVAAVLGELGLSILIQHELHPYGGEDGEADADGEGADLTLDAAPSGGEDSLTDPDEDFDGDPDEAWVAPEPEAYPARVVDMRAVVGNAGGSKRPKTGVSFLVTFLLDDGKRIEYPVPEELYVTLNLDRTGTLVILNGGFFDFGDGEETE